MTQNDKTLDYPPTTSLNKPRPARLKDTLWRLGETLRWRLRKFPDLSHHLNAIDKIAQIGANEIVVLTRQHNSLRFVRSFVQHYRALGADRIVVIDDASTDGSREFLKAQSDVIVLQAHTGYADAERGRNWFDAVLARLPKGQKMVVVDIDEYLVFSDGQRKLPELFATMARSRRQKLCAIMIDCYPKAPISAAVFDGTTDQMPWEIAPCFDATGYAIQNKRRGSSVTGGVRHRVFGENLILSKYPVLFNPGKPVFTISIHSPQPLTYNHVYVDAVLLHFKYFSDFIEDHKRVVSRGVHYRGGEAYQAVLDKLNGVDVDNDFSFEGATTTTYEGPAQLCKLGLMADICAG